MPMMPMPPPKRRGLPPMAPVPPGPVPGAPPAVGYAAGGEVDDPRDMVDPRSPPPDVDMPQMAQRPDVPDFQGGAPARNFNPAVLAPLLEALRRSQANQLTAGRFPMAPPTAMGPR